MDPDLIRGRLLHRTLGVGSLNTWLVKHVGPSELGSIRPTSTGLGMA